MYKFLPDKVYFRELRRPWKLVTLAIGMGWLLYGALVYEISDWDIGVSLIMGGLTYICAPWSLYIIINSIRYRPHGWQFHLITAFLPAAFAIDWSYWLYHSAMGNRMLRWENFKVSTALYFICGLIWYYRGSISDMVNEVKRRER